MNFYTRTKKLVLTTFERRTLEGAAEICRALAGGFDMMGVSPAEPKAAHETLMSLMNRLDTSIEEPEEVEA